MIHNNSKPCWPVHLTRAKNVHTDFCVHNCAQGMKNDDDAKMLKMFVHDLSGDEG